MSIHLSVVLPTYNEAPNLPGLVGALFALPIEPLSVIVVDDASPDGTGMLAEQLSRQYSGRISVQHRSAKLGLGSAYLLGFRCALSQGAQAVAQMDSDFSHPPEKLVEMLAALQNSDVVIGSRYVAGGGVDRNWPRWRKGLSAFGNHYARTILNLPIRDATGGFRIWRRETLESMPLERIRSTGYAFQVEMAYLANRMGFSQTEIPIYFSDRRWGKSKMSFSIQSEAAFQVWEMKIRYADLHPHPALASPHCS
jgi:dolichol-phosphate mannosyltransferase